MHATSRLVRPLPFALAAALLAPGCVVHLGDWGSSCTDVFGNSVETRDNVLYVDDVRLPFDRWVDVTADLSDAVSLELATASDRINVTGVEGSTAALRAHLYSEVDGDGEAVFDGGRLVARSRAGNKVFINAIEGTLPAGLALQVESSTGPITVASLSGTGALVASNGTGDVTLRSCEAGSVKIETGTGDMRMEDCHAPDIKLDTGTGDAELLRCRADKVKLNTGTGDGRLTGCVLGEFSFDSGTGDLVLDGGQIDRVASSTGTGDLKQRNGVKIGSLDES